MKRALAALFALVLAAGLMTSNAEAARLGGGRSLGTQRMAPMQRQATPPAAAPQKAQPGTPAAQPGNRWLGPLAGLAAGLGLGWLLSNGALGGFGGVLMMALLAVVVVMLLSRFFGAKRAPGRPMQYANLGGNDNSASSLHEITPGTSAATARAYAPKVPAGFDVETFLKHAKRNFLQLQEANDRADTQELREVTTPEMYEQLKGDVAARNARQQQTEVVALNAEVLEVVTEGDTHWASVRFSGSVREAPSAPAEPFDEVWHLQKPANGQTGWLLAGIQQPA